MSEYKYILRTETLYKSFGHLEVLKDVNLSVQKGEVICIIGPSGAGKSTYLRSLNQLETITSRQDFHQGRALPSPRAQPHHPPHRAGKAKGDAVGNGDGVPEL